MKKLLVSATTTVALVLGGAAFAHQGASGVVKERMEMMKDSGKQMKVIGSMVKGEAKFDGKKASQAALAISDHANEIPKLFPKGTNKHPSEAKADIWQNWKGFEAAAQDLQDKAGKLAELADHASAASDISAQFMQVGKSCGACHETFRVKK